MGNVASHVFWPCRVSVAHGVAVAFVVFSIAIAIGSHALLSGARVAVLVALSAAFTIAALAVISCEVLEGKTVQRGSVREPLTTFPVVKRRVGTPSAQSG